eukprot:GCRY01002709.1.p1 GENE.GCRY01002709.1~~GCRY01002709.1.p1  ORF type:complete len:435 (+),score=39.64 GCRY01002709.1:177-1481(+)
MEAAHQEAALYLEEKGVFQIYEQLTKALIRDQPENVNQYLIQQLKLKPLLRVCIVGPPSCSKGVHAPRLAEDFSIEHIKTSELLREKCPQDFEVALTEGSYVEDDLVIKVIMDKIKECESNNTGWLLEGFPLTKRQALALHREQVILDKLIFLDIPVSSVLVRFGGRRLDESTGKLYHEVYNPAPAELQSRLVVRPQDTYDQITKKYAMFELNFKPVLNLLQYAFCRVRDDLTQKAVFESLSTLLKTPASAQPLTQPRLALLGLNHDLLSQLGKKFKEEGFSVFTAQSVFGRQHLKPFCKQAAFLYEQGQPIPADLVAQVLKSELEAKTQRSKKGWIMINFPENIEQMKIFVEEGIAPTRCVVFDSGESLPSKTYLFGKGTVSDVDDYQSHLKSNIQTLIQEHYSSGNLCRLDQTSVEDSFDVITDFLASPKMS